MLGDCAEPDWTFRFRLFAHRFVVDTPWWPGLAEGQSIDCWLPVRPPLLVAKGTSPTAVALVLTQYCQCTDARWTSPTVVGLLLTMAVLSADRCTMDIAYPTVVVKFI